LVFKHKKKIEEHEATRVGKKLPPVFWTRVSSTSFLPLQAAVPTLMAFARDLCFSLAKQIEFMTFCFYRYPCASPHTEFQKNCPKEPPGYHQKKKRPKKKLGGCRAQIKKSWIFFFHLGCQSVNYWRAYGCLVQQIG